VLFQGKRAQPGTGPPITRPGHPPRAVAAARARRRDGHDRGDRLRELSKPDRQLLRQVCAFVYPDVPHIFVVPTCPAYRGAETSLFEAIKLAGILRHELAHVAGADEREARRQESKAVRLMLRRAPAEHQTPGMLYAAELDAHASNGDP
jgi:hypothetical protein